MSGQRPVHLQNLAFEEQSHRRTQQQSLREAQRKIRSYYILRLRLIYWIAIEVSFGIGLTLLALTLHIFGIHYLRDATHKFGFLMLRLIFWTCCVLISGVIALIILHAERFRSLSASIRYAWTHLKNLQLLQFDRYSIASYNLVAESNSTITAPRVRLFLHRLRKNLAKPEFRSRYESILTRQADQSSAIYDPRVQNVSENQFLSQAGNSRTASDSHARHSRNYEFENFINALAELGRCGETETIPGYTRQLVNRYEAKIIQKINENQNQEWRQISNHGEFLVFIKENWSNWFSQSDYSQS